MFCLFVHMLVGFFPICRQYELETDQEGKEERGLPPVIMFSV